MKKYLIIIPLIILTICTTIFCIKTFNKNDEPLNIYIFSGDGCPHCESELKVLSKIEEEYKGKVKVYNYETWYNTNNKVILNKVAEKFNIELKGVPFTVIGDEYFVGFLPTTEQKIRDMVDKNLKDNKKVDIVKPIVDEMNER